MSSHYEYKPLPRAALSGSLNATELSLTVKAGGGASFPTGPHTITVSLGTLLNDPTLAELSEAETIEVTSRDGDDFTLRTRNVNSNASPLTHTDSNLVQQLVTPDDFVHLQTKIDALEFILAGALGSLDTGVKTYSPDYDQLEVVEQDTPNMTLKVKLGGGMAGRKTCYLAADFSTAALATPSGSTRHDLVSIDSASDLIVVTTGAEAGSVPSTPAGHIALADITLTTSQATLTTGAITDVRKTY